MSKYVVQCVRCSEFGSVECDNCDGLNFEKKEDELICKNCKVNLISIIHLCGKGESFGGFGDWDWNTEEIESITYYPKNKDNCLKFMTSGRPILR